MDLSTFLAVIGWVTAVTFGVEVWALREQNEWLRNKLDNQLLRVRFLEGKTEKEKAA